MRAGVSRRNARVAVESKVRPSQKVLEFRAERVSAITSSYARVLGTITHTGTVYSSVVQAASLSPTTPLTRTLLPRHMIYSVLGLLLWALKKAWGERRTTITWEPSETRSATQ